jgi:hypothetical protein
MEVVRFKAREQSRPRLDDGILPGIEAKSLEVCGGRVSTLDRASNVSTRFQLAGLIRGK